MIKSHTQTTVKNQARVDNLKKYAKQLKTAYVKIGITDESGSYGAGGPEVVEVALWMEFGTETVPARSYIGATMDENRSLLNKWREECLTKIAAGIWSVQEALDAMGQRITILIQNKIRSNVPPALSEEYARRKRAEGFSTNTLVRTETMLRSVTWKVFMQ